jgi:hypothetical protein
MHKITTTREITKKSIEINKMISFLGVLGPPKNDRTVTEYFFNLGAAATPQVIHTSPKVPWSGKQHGASIHRHVAIQYQRIWYGS